MKIFKLCLIIFLLVLIIGGIGLFYYVAFWKPRDLHAQEQKAPAQAAPMVTATPDYTVPAFEKAMGLLKAGNIPEARQALTDFITAYPQSSKISDVKKALGDLNTTEFFSATASPDKSTYTVVRGDSLVRIASHFKTNAELIFQINNLANINLKIGQELLIPKPEVSILIDRKNHTLTLLNHGQFFKEYPILALKVGNLPPHGTVQSKVTDKLAMQNGKRLAFGDKDYFGSERHILLAHSGLIIRSAPQNTPQDQMPGGIVLAAPDIEEMFAMVNRGTPVTIE